MSTSESLDVESKSPSQLAALALALSRHGALPSSKLIAAELSSVIAEVARNKSWETFQQAIAEVKNEPLALEALLSAAHLIVSRVSVQSPSIDQTLRVELAALPVVLEPGSKVRVTKLADHEGLQRTLAQSMSEGTAVLICGELLTESEAFGSPQRAQQLMERLLEQGSIADLRQATLEKLMPFRSRGELRFMPGVLIHEAAANPWRGRLTTGLREKFAQAANAQLCREGKAARLRFGELSPWSNVRREGHALHQAVKVELALARVCDKLGSTLSEQQAYLSAVAAPFALTVTFARKGQDATFLERRFSSWSEAYYADLVREFAQVAFAHGMAIHADDVTSPLLEACMALYAVPQTVRTLVAEGRCHVLATESSTQH
jgi:hypothetical protein